MTFRKRPIRRLSWLNLPTLLNWKLLRTMATSRLKRPLGKSSIRSFLSKPNSSTMPRMPQFRLQIRQELLLKNKLLLTIGRLPCKKPPWMSIKQNSQKLRRSSVLPRASLKQTKNVFESLSFRNPHLKIKLVSKVLTSPSNSSSTKLNLKRMLTGNRLNVARKHS